MHQVDRHSEMLYELDTKMTIMNKDHSIFNVEH